MKKKKILIVGSGAREDAIGSKLFGPDRELYFAPGNPGTARWGQNVPIPATMIGQLCTFAQENEIDFTIVGPEDPLFLGIGNLFRSRGLKIFAPTQAAAHIEESKAYAKDIMCLNRIPTAEYATFDNYTEALKHVSFNPHCYIKASGPAKGKGANECHTVKEAENILFRLMVEREFGEAGSTVVIEKILEGKELSVHALCDDHDFIMFPFTRDHKQALDGNKGDMTGGMGAYGPVDEHHVVYSQIRTGIVEMTLEALAFNDVPFNGLLFPGIKLTNNGPHVLEFNARFGDPETQVLMQLFSTDLLELLEACVDNRLSEIEMSWRPGTAVCVVMASGGYPGPYKTGFPIIGIEEAEKLPGVTVFHAGTEIKDGQLVTAGGRVLAVTCYADTLQLATDNVYEATKRIRFEGMHYRSDIGKQSLETVVS